MDLHVNNTALNIDAIILLWSQGYVKVLLEGVHRQDKGSFFGNFRFQAVYPNTFMDFPKHKILLRNTKTLDLHMWHKVSNNGLNPQIFMSISAVVHK